VADLTQSLVKEIVLTPEGGEFQTDVRGDLTGILAISLKSKRPVAGAGRSQVKMVAGRRDHQSLRDTKSNGVRGQAGLLDGLAFWH
jgi:site-specific DNA recombinase